MNSTGGSSWGWKKRSKESAHGHPTALSGTRRAVESDRRGGPSHVGDRSLRGRGREYLGLHRVGNRPPPHLPGCGDDRAAGRPARDGWRRVPGQRLGPPPAGVHPGPRSEPRLRARRSRGPDRHPLHLAAAALRPAHQRVQLAPGGPPRPGAADRDELPYGDPRAAAAPGLPEPRPPLSG